MELHSRDQGSPDSGRPAPRPTGDFSYYVDSSPIARRKDRSRLARLMALVIWLLVLAALLALLDSLKSRQRMLLNASRPPATAPAPPNAAPAPEEEDAAEAPEPEPIAPPPAPLIETPVAEAPPVPALDPPLPERETVRVVELVLQPSPNGNFYVKGEINRQPVIFMIDTGASAVSVPERLKWKLNLARERYIQSSTANGIAGMYETHIASLGMGPIRLNGVNAVLNPNAPDDVVLLGMSALREIRLLHQADRMVLQQTQRPGQADADADTESGAPEVPAIRKSIKDCMGEDKVIDDKVLRCMQGE